MVDPICALKEIREIHGDHTLEFSGELNKGLYADALAYIQPSRGEQDV